MHISSTVILTLFVLTHVTKHYKKPDFYSEECCLRDFRIKTEGYFKVSTCACLVQSHCLAATALEPQPSVYVNVKRA